MFRGLGRILRSAVAEKTMRVQKAITGLEPKGCLPEPDQEPDFSPLDPRSILLGGAIHAARTCFVGEVVGDVENQLYDLKKKLLILGTCKPNVCTAEDIMNDARLNLKDFSLLDKRAVSECIKDYVSVLLKVETSDCYYQYLIHLVMGDYIKLSTSPEVLLQILRVQNVFHDLDRSILECAVEDYVNLCKEHCPSSSEDSKDHLVAHLHDERADEMSSVYMTEIRRSLFTTSIRVGMKR